LKPSELRDLCVTSTDNVFLLPLLYHTTPLPSIYPGHLDFLVLSVEVQYDPDSAMQVYNRHWIAPEWLFPLRDQPSAAAFTENYFDEPIFT
jgi:hypothetical protein